MTQTERVLEHMERRGGITALQAQNDYGIMRLGARIWDLKRAGHRISSETVSGVNRYGEKTRFTRYTLAGNDIQKGERQ